MLDSEWGAEFLISGSGFCSLALLLALQELVIDNWSLIIRRDSSSYLLRMTKEAFLSF